MGPSVEGQSAPATRGFVAELRDAISLRAFLLVVGGLVLQIGFIASYIGAFHSPSPHRIPVAVVAPPQASAPLAGRLDGLPRRPVKAIRAADEAAARAKLLHRSADAALVVDPATTTDRLLVASAGGPAVSDAAAQIIGTLERAQNRSLTVVDIRPPAKGDSRGLSSFYLVVGWMVGGYLAAAILGVASGARPANRNRTIIRLAALALYAIVSGMAGAVVVGPIYGTLTGHLFALWGIGALIVFAAAAATVAFQVLLGIIGIGIAILVFVIVGNPSAGGPYPGPLLPAFWRVLGPLIPTGAGTTAVRNTVYFAGNATGGALLTLGIWALAGIAVSVLAVSLRTSRTAAGA